LEDLGVKRALVTGSNGFVGRRFVRRLVDDGWLVTAVDDLSVGIVAYKWAFLPKTGVGGFDFMARDVREFFNSFRADPYDLIVHCAAVVGGRQNIDGDPLGVAQNLAIDADFFRWLARTGQRDQKIVYFSSSAVYPVDLQTERSHCKLSEGLVDLSKTRLGMPDQTYGWSKLSGERLAKVAVEQHGMDIKIFRPFGGCGPDQDMSYPWPSIIQRILNRENPIVVWGSGEQQRDFITIENIVDLVLITMDMLAPGESLNLGTGKATSFKELARLACLVLEHKAKIMGDESKPQGVFSRVSDPHKLLTLLPHWQPINLELSIRETAAFLKQRVS
jgi:nucleoside-diphosphate-sugar epimerase